MVQRSIVLRWGVTNLSTVEFKIEFERKQGRIKEGGMTKYFRTIDEVYYADIKLNAQPVSIELKALSKMIVTNTVSAAAEFIKIGDLKSAQLFVSMRLHVDYLAHGLKTSGIPIVGIYSIIKNGEWVEVL